MSASRFAVSAAFVMLSLLAARPAPGEEVEEVKWTKDVEAAWKTTIEQQRHMLIYVTTDKCKFCRLMESKTFSDPGIAAQINKSFIAVTLYAKGEGSRLVKVLGVKTFPTTLVISYDKKLIDTIKGYLPADEMKVRLASAVSKKPAPR